MYTAKLLLLAVAFVACNCAAIEKDPFIVGGEPAEIADFPHSLALLDMVRGGASGYMCGASNVHRLWALTAAHCLDFGTPATQVRKFFFTKKSR